MAETALVYAVSGNNVLVGKNPDWIRDLITEKYSKKSRERDQYITTYERVPIVAGKTDEQYSSEFLSRLPALKADPLVKGAVEPTVLNGEIHATGVEDTSFPKNTKKTNLAYPRTEYTFPKGGINAGEAPKDAAIREFREEMFYDISGLPITDGVVVGKTVVFQVDVTDVEAAVLAAYSANKLRSELFDVKFVPITDVKKLRMNSQSTDALKQLVPTPGLTAEQREARSREYEILRSQGYSEEDANDELKTKYGSGRKTRRTGRSKLGTKKRHTRGRAGKTRRTQ